jgi:hypothetical protein
MRSAGARAELGADPQPSKENRMNVKTIVLGVLLATGLATMAAQDKYTVTAPGAPAFAEFRGYESWQVISVSHHGGMLAMILGNPVMIKAMQSGIPGNGKPFPDGARIAKIHYVPKQMEPFPSATVPGVHHDSDFMVKDSKRFADSGGWGYVGFEHDVAAGTWRPRNTKDEPPMGNDAKCGAACHTIVKSRDYVFTEYAER